MFSLGDDNLRAGRGWRRREWLRVGGLSCFGLSLPRLLQAAAVPRDSVGGAPPSTSFGRAKSCLLVFLTGGPPQHETFDPKPQAPLEIRGEFGTVRTSVPGLRFSELLPETARQAHRLAVVRSMTTDNNSHATSGYWMLTGNEHRSKAESEPVSFDDWPSLAATIGALKPSDRSPLSAVVLPEPIHNNPNVPWPGQNGGFMGSAWHPYLFKCDPTGANVAIDGLEGIIPELRLRERESLLAQVDAHFKQALRQPSIADADRMHHKAFEVIRHSSIRTVLQMEREAGATRDRYGRGKFGQSLLLARRLLQNGTRLVQVNWPREPGDTNIGNPVWDTHSANAARCREVLCPQFDRGFAALLDDLNACGLLDETLVVVLGEFGRSPKVNADGGRDHWGHAFSVVLAGAGIPGGQVIGATDRIGGYVDDRPLRPTDLAATIFHLLGIRPNMEIQDTLQRPRILTDGGQPIRELVGTVT